MEENSAFDSFQPQFTQEAKGFLRTASGWSMFLSICGFLSVLFGFFMSIALFASLSLAPTPTPGAEMLPTMGGIGIICTLVLLLPVVFLFKFSLKAKKAADSDDVQEITAMFRNLKNYFMWSGILTIVWIVSYIVFMISVVSTGFSNM